VGWAGDWVDGHVGVGFGFRFGHVGYLIDHLRYCWFDDHGFV
jgi:hypothetical protein